MPEGVGELERTPAALVERTSIYQRRFGTYLEKELYEIENMDQLTKKVRRDIMFKILKMMKNLSYEILFS